MRTTRSRHSIVRERGQKPEGGGQRFEGGSDGDREATLEPGLDIVHPDLLALRVQLTVLDRVHQLGSRRPGVVGSTRQVQPGVAGPDDGLEGGHGLTIGSPRPNLDPRLGKAWMSRARGRLQA